MIAGIERGREEGAGSRTSVPGRWQKRGWVLEKMDVLSEAVKWLGRGAGGRTEFLRFECAQAGQANESRIF